MTLDTSTISGCPEVTAVSTSKPSRPADNRQFVSRRTAASLLDLSPAGFDIWVKKGIAPPPAAGSPVHTPRWRWSEIERWLGGDRSGQRNLFPADAPAVPGKKRGRPRVKTSETKQTGATNGE